MIIGCGRSYKDMQICSRLRMKLLELIAFIKRMVMEMKNMTGFKNANALNGDMNCMPIISAIAKADEK